MVAKRKKKSRPSRAAPAPEPPVQAGPPAGYWPALALFFLSGACSLVYEIVWSRTLVLVLGNTTLATSTILASFMAGLALGSYFWGRYIASHPQKPLAVFGGLEIGVGLFALVFPYLLRLSVPVDQWLSGSGTAQAQVMLRFLFCFILLLIPTFLMGGTLAVVGQYIIPERTRFARDSALLYGINTLGAVAGTLGAGFFFIRLWGHGGTQHLAMGINLAVGAAALILGRRQVEISPPVKKTKKKAGRAERSAKPVFFLTALVIGLSGFTALAYEVIWTRLLILLVDNSVYSFTIILTAVLTGLALGSLLLAAFSRYIKDPAFALALVEIGLGASAFAFPFAVRLGPFDNTQPYWLFMLVKLPIVLLIPTIFMGASLPLAARVFEDRRRETGRSLGGVYGINTLGGVLGAALAGLYMVPTWGFRATTLILLAINLGVGMSLLAVRLRRTTTLISAGLLAAALVLAFLAMPGDFFPRTYARLEPESKLVYYHEGRAATSNIFARPDGNSVLYLNGLAEVESRQLAVRTFKLMGALPGLIQGPAEDVLMITFGAGITASAAAPLSDRVDCVDLVEDYRGIAGYFGPANEQITDNPKFHFHLDDARHFLQTSRKKYDVIVSDATHPRSNDSWILFTEEFYELVASKLKPGGIFSQWLPYHGLNPDQYLAIINTFKSRFPHTSLWEVGGAYSLLLATPEPLTIDFNEMAARLRRTETAGTLRSSGLDNPFEVLSHFLMGEDNLERLIAGARLITDNDPIHLFFPFTASLKEQYEEWPRTNYERVMVFKESVIPYLVNVGDSELEKNKFIDLIRNREATP